MAELGVVAGEDDIAVTDELGGAGETVAVDLGDHGFRQGPEALPAIDHLLQAEAIAVDGKAGALPLGRLEVVTGAEGAAGAANNQDARAVVAFILAHHLVELAEQLLRHRVELLGPVER